ncbi:glycosyltransferase family 2 protein [Campylobacter troglodytis]|uniref:glycosyltransferase family 2 protein n=1 Tax=Campylobacter troglodytis TaxID=654363 RepID=UPI00115B11CF|nr:glycosyltransferase family A protein [Campylobacter troglodytis]TQR60746.1 hypothetical protein DMC01_04380 [Campylobacter troglodytis]
MYEIKNKGENHLQISIIVPIYNVAPYLKECLQSLVHQSYENLDIVLIDDGSSDGSLEIALEFAASDSRIFVVSKPNGGLSSARNFGLEFIKGSALREFFENSQKSPLPCRVGFCNAWLATSWVGVGAKSQNTQNSANSQKNSQNQKSLCLAEGDLGGGLLKNNSQNSVNLMANSQNSSILQEKGVENLQNFKNNNFANAKFTHPLTPSAREGEQNARFSARQGALYDKEIPSLTQTHTFNKSYKNISDKEIKAHFTQIQSNFIKSDLTRINDFIIQELPSNALIHFVDSDDYLTKDCIEKCVKALQEGDLDIVAHNITHFYEDDKSFKQGAYLRLKQSSYNTGLELLTQNKLYSFYFSWQGLFKAHILNRYALRFSEGIYHEDHDFGTLLFCLANKVAYTNEALYIYRQRTNSIITTQKNKAFPAKLPYFLEPLKKDFKDYKALRAYFKGYCFVKVGFNIWHFYTQKSLQNAEFKEKFKHFFIKSTLSYMKIFKSPLNPDTLGIKGLLGQISFPKITVFCEFFKDLHRQPKKIRYILHLKYLLKKDTK